jgi:S1-C subfamily serine protease
VQPQREDFDYDLERVLTAVVGIKATVATDAFTAETLGTERAGTGVLIDGSGLVLTIGYLITEAETVWITLTGGRVVPGHVLGYDQETGFGLVQALARLNNTPFLPLGSSASARPGDSVVVAAAGGRQKAIACTIRSKQEFAGYWEYVLDEAIFTTPAHPAWSGTALIGPAGDLLGIGSLQLQQQVVSGGRDAKGKGTTVDVNMSVPIDLLKPILEDLKTLGQRRAPPRPWLGLFATEVGDRIVIAGVSGRGPARISDVRPGDVVLNIGGQEIKSLANFFRAIWAQGQAGVEVPMLLHRNGRTLDLKVKSADRAKLLKGPVLH